MRILILSEVFYPEDFMVNSIAQEWVKMGHHVEVISQYPSYPQSYVYDDYINKGFTTEVWNNITIHRFPFIEGYKNKKRRKFLNYYVFVKGAKKIAKKIGKNFDVIFVSQTGPLTVALPALVARKKHKIPVAILTLDIWPDVVWSYGMPKNKLTEWLLNKLIKKIYTHCDTIFISSKRFEDTIKRYTSTKPIYTPNWLRSVEQEKSELRLNPAKFNFTFTGNISRYQNLNKTIKGFHKANIENSILNIVGNGSYLENVQYYVERNNIKNVKFRGRFPYNEMGDIMNQSDVLVLPLIPDEGICKTEPLKLQSYLEAGKPILGILNGSGRDIIEEYGLGVCANPDNSDDIARAFQEIHNFTAEQKEQVKMSSCNLLNTRFNKDSIMKVLTDNLPTSIIRK